MKRLFATIPVVACLLLGACSLPTRLDDPDSAPMQSRAASASAEDAQGMLHAELIQEMLAQGQYYAALAHIQQMTRDRGDSPELRYLEAEARRKLGQQREPEALYRGLLRNRAYSGLAYQGLGLLAAARDDLKTAVQHLRVAAERRPTDAEVRNDLGYALMLAGRYQEALPEIATAAELDGGRDRSRNNLLVLLMLKRDEAGIKRMVADSGISEQELARLRAQAQSLTKRTRAQEKPR